MSLESSLEQLVDLTKKRDEVHFNFIKQVLLMASGLLGILVSLHKSSATSTLSRLCFAVALILLAFGILCLSVALYAQVAVAKQMFLKWKQEVLMQLRDQHYRIKPVAGEPSKFYGIMEMIGYVSLLLSLIGLTIYAVTVA